MGALVQSRGWLPIVEAPGYSRHPTPILAMQLLNAFKCNLKELTTKSAFSAWGQRPLACACPVAGHIDHVIHWRVQFSFVLGSVSHFLPLSPPSRLCWFFSSDVFFFSVWRVRVPFLSCGGSWLCCAVVQVMGTLFQSRGWLPIVEAPGYSRHPTSFLAMQLLNWIKTRSWDYSIQVDFYATHITRTTFATDIGEFVGTFRYAANEFYLKIGFTDYSGYHKEIIL